MIQIQRCAGSIFNDESIVHATPTIIIIYYIYIYIVYNVLRDSVKSTVRLYAQMTACYTDTTKQDMITGNFDPKKSQSHEAWNATPLVQCISNTPSHYLYQLDMHIIHQVEESSPHIGVAFTREPEVQYLHNGNFEHSQFFSWLLKRNLTHYPPTCRKHRTNH